MHPKPSGQVQGCMLRNHLLTRVLSPRRTRPRAIGDYHGVQRTSLILWVEVNRILNYLICGASLTRDTPNEWHPDLPKRLFAVYCVVRGGRRAFRIYKRA